jgi:hypothetical protein
MSQEVLLLGALLPPLINVNTQDIRCKGLYILSRSTIARSAPLKIKAWLIINPNPLAPPVTTPTFLSREKEDSVLL